jgi:hypothetical protein
MNTAFGSEDHLVFNLRHRRNPICFSLDSPKSSDKDKVRKVLIQIIEKAINDIMKSSPFGNSSIMSYFSEETNRAKELVQTMPPLWEYHLAQELLRSKLMDIGRSREDLDRDLTYKRAIRLDGIKYFAWIQERMADLENIIAVFMKIINEELIASFGPLGHPGDPIRIKDCVNKLIEGCRHLIEWEIKRRAVIPPESFIKLHELQKGWSLRLIDSVEKLHNELAKIHPGMSGPHEIKIVFEAPKEIAEALTEIKRLRENPMEWI